MLVSTSKIASPPLCPERRTAYFFPITSADLSFAIESKVSTIAFTELFPHSGAAGT